MNMIRVLQRPLIPEGDCHYEVIKTYTEDKTGTTKAVIKFDITYDENGESKSQALVQKYSLVVFPGSDFSNTIAALTGQELTDEFDLDTIVGLKGEGRIHYVDYNGGQFPNLTILSVG